MLRDGLVWLHRYAGLAMAAFIVLTGVTGSILAFQHEIDAALNPALFRAEGRGAPLPPIVLAARVEAADPRMRVVGLPLKVEPGWAARLSVLPRLDPATGKRFAAAHDQVFVDPVTGAVLGMRLARDALIPILYRFHYTLLDPSAIGRQLLGWVALAWTLDCFVGAYLTLPRGRPFLVRWRAAWQVKRGASAFRLNLDLHRAGGLWLWAVLFVVALSSVYYNLHASVFRPAVELFSPVTRSIFDQVTPDARRALAGGQAVGFVEAARVASDAARQRGWEIEPGFIYHHVAYGFHAVRFWPSQNDRGSGLGRPILYVDDNDGHIVSEVVPGEGTAGDMVMQLQYPLHSGRLAGLPGRILVCVSGLVVSMLAITGVVIWWKKLRGRRLRKIRGEAI